MLPYLISKLLLQCLTGWVVHCSSIHISNHDAPDSWYYGGQAKDKWVVSEALPQCKGCRDVRPTWNPYANGSSCCHSSFINSRLWSIHLYCWKYCLWYARLRVASHISSLSDGFSSEDLAENVGLCYTGYWSSFCWLWHLWRTLRTLHESLILTSLDVDFSKLHSL